MPAVLDLIARGGIHPAPVITDVMDWEEAPRAFSQARGKAVVVRHY